MATKQWKERKTDDVCCEFFKHNIRNFSWHSYDKGDGVKQWLMPVIKGTNVRVNFCPTCGGLVRDVIISDETYNNANLNIN